MAAALREGVDDSAFVYSSNTACHACEAPANRSKPVDPEFTKRNGT